jgi:glycosyltransferase involved in cell wall biosynthesis
MKILFLGGVFSKANSLEVLSKSKYAVDFAANIYQEKLIEGFKTIGCNLQIISAPFIGPYPKSYTQAWFNGFKESSEEYKYVNFCNIFGVRNYSRYRSIKQSLNDFINIDDNDKLIVIYSAHTPFIKAASYAKRKDPRIKICMIVLDLPQYMNLSSKQSLLYRCGKKLDIRQFNKYNLYVDSYLLLTEHMTEQIDMHGAPYIIQEGIADPKDLLKSSIESGCSSKRTILYAGTLNEKYGIKTLVDAFRLMEGKHLCLVICGRGDSEEYICSASKQDSRIHYIGQVTPNDVKELMKSADILVNPRPNNEIYTRYSFPSKNIEYLLSGKVVLGYKLDGMPDCYKQFMVIVKEDSQDAIMNMHNALVSSLNIESYDNLSFLSYAKEHLSADIVAKKIIKLNSMNCEID